METKIFFTSEVLVNVTQPFIANKLIIRGSKTFQYNNRNSSEHDNTKENKSVGVKIALNEDNKVPKVV